MGPVVDHAGSNLTRLEEWSHAARYALRHHLPPDFKQELGMRVTEVKQRIIESEAPEPEAHASREGADWPDPGQGLLLDEAEPGPAREGPDMEDSPDAAAAIAAMAAGWLVLVHAVPAQAGGSQQELCALITSARHAVGPEMAAMERTSDPARLRALHRQMSAAAPPYIAQMNRFVGRGYRFRNYTGTVTNLSPDGNPALGPVGIDLLVALSCAQSPAAVFMRFPLIGVPDTRQAPLDPAESSLERFKPVLVRLRRGSRVVFSGTLFPYQEPEAGTRLLFRNVTLRFDARVTRLRKS